jgi:hypothetical protein
MIKKKNYIILFMKPESLDDPDGHHGSGLQLIASNERLIEFIEYKTP